MAADNPLPAGNPNPKKGDSNNPANRAQPISLSSSSTASNANQRSNASHNPNANQGRPPRSNHTQQGDRQHNAPSSRRQSSNFGSGGSSGGGGRHHHNRNSHRHPIDPNMPSNHNHPSNSSSGGGGPNHHKHGYYSRNRYDQGHHHHGNPRHHDNKNNPPPHHHNHHPSPAGDAGVPQNDPRKGSGLNNIVMDFSEFPSFSDTPTSIAAAAAAAATSNRPTSDSGHPVPSAITSVSGNNNHRRGSTGNASSSVPTAVNNQPLFVEPTTVSNTTTTSNSHTNFPNHSPNTSSTTRPYHQNSRRSGGGGGGNYNRNSNREHQQGGGRDNYARGSGANQHRSSNASQQMRQSNADVTSSATSPSNVAGGGATAATAAQPNTSSNNSTNTSRNQQEGQPSHHHQGQSSSSVTPAVTTSTRSRGNRRGGNNMGGGYEQHGRRSSNRDFNQLPNMMNGMRIGSYPPGTQMPTAYFNGSRSYGPPPPPHMMAPGVHPTMPIQPFVPVAADVSGGGAAVPPTADPTFTSPEKTSDMEEAELYKALTSDPHIPQEDQAMYQIEFYFSNCNLKHDSYLRNQMDSEGYVYAPTVLGFNRIAKFGVTVAQLIKMMEKTTKLEHKVVGDRTYIRRKEDPTKWTNSGLAKQNRTATSVTRAAPAIESEAVPIGPTATTASFITSTGNATGVGGNMPSHHQGVHIPPHMHPATNYGFGYQRYAHPMHHPGGATYMSPFAAPQIPLNYSGYAYEDMSGNIYYDGSALASFDFAAVPYIEPTTTHNNSPIVAVAASLPITSTQAPQSDVLNLATAASNVVTSAGDRERISQQQHQPQYGTGNAAALLTSPRIEPNLGGSQAPRGVDTLMTDMSDLVPSMQLNTEEYNILLNKVLSQRKRQIVPSVLSKFPPTHDKDLHKLYLYWTQNLVLNFEQAKYDMFKRLAMEDSKCNQPDGLILLYQFYERFLHRFPLTSATDSAATAGGDVQPGKRLSLKIFEDFQQISYEEYLENESVAGLKKLLRFKTQFTNPSRQPPGFNQRVQELISSLGLDDSQQNNTLLNGDRAASAANNAPAADRTTGSKSPPTSKKNSDNQSSISTHH